MRNLRNKLHAACLVLVLSLGMTVGCATTTINPDGSVVISEPDYQAIELLSVAAVSGWAATQKDGIKPEDAVAMLEILNTINDFHKDGTPVDSMKWIKPIREQVPPRYQALMIAMVQLTEYALNKYGVMDQIPTPDSTSLKVLQAIAKGAKMGLTPYLPIPQSRNHGNEIPISNVPVEYTI